MSAPPITRSTKFCLISASLVLIAFASLPTLQSVSANAFRTSNRYAATTPHARNETLIPVVNTILVNSTADIANSSDGLCTLREAITAANNNVASGGTLGECAAGSSSESDTIDLSELSGTIAVTNALPTISSNATINGPGSASLTVQRNGNFDGFTSGSAATVTISGLTVQGVGIAGNAGISSMGNLNITNCVISGFGRGVMNNGLLTVTISNCVITGNTNGGGILNSQGTLNLINSVVSANESHGDFGPGIQNTAKLNVSNSTITGSSGHIAIFNLPGGTATFTNSTVSNNVDGGLISSGNLTMTGGLVTGNSKGGIIAGGTAVINGVTVSNNSNNSGAFIGGGGIFINGNAVTVINCVVTNNSTTGNGGGIRNGGGKATIVNTTVSGNTSFGGGGGIDTVDGGLANFIGINLTVTGNKSNSGGGVIRESGPMKFKNSLIAGNFALDGVTPNDISGVVDASSSFNVIGVGGSGGLSNGVNNNQVGIADPRLGPLVNNGGPTMTHALLSDSPALDAGDNCVTDVAHCGDASIPQLLADQRGLNRSVDGPDGDSTATVDVGAYEKQAVFPNLADVSTTEDTQLLVGFDLDDIASVISVTATSSNSTLVPNDAAHINVGVFGSTGILTINPATNLYGMSDITVTVDRTGGSASRTFLLTVLSGNDAPSFLKGADQSVNENDPAQTVDNWATGISPGPADESGQTMAFEIVSNSNPTLFAAGPAISSQGTLSYTPANGRSGTAAIVIRLKDNGGTANGGTDTSATQTFNINVREGGILRFSNITYSVSESGVSVLITVSRSFGSAGETRVDYATSDNGATAGEDYTSVSGTLTFPDGVTSQTFSVPILDDTFDENNETVTLSLSNPVGSGAIAAPTTSSLFITDDDPRPTITINDAPTIEGNSGSHNAVFTVTLTGSTKLQVVVSYSTANNTADFFDYQPTAGQLVFSPGETTKTINVPIVGDTLFESNETFFLNLSTPTNATLTRFFGVGTILNDDTAVQFSGAAFAINEGSPFMSITVNRLGDVSGPATVKYASSDTTDVNFNCNPNTAGQPTGAASRKCDYHIAAGRLRFAPGETSKQIVISIVNDVYVEPSESLTVALSNPTGAQLGMPATTSIRIDDNDPPNQPNPIDGTPFYVRMLYVDLLSREPDPAGFDGWVHRIDFCGQPGEPPPPCDRVTVGGDGFLRSAEFFDREFFVIRLYRTALGRILRYDDVADLAFVSGFLTDGDLELNKQEVINDIMSRPEFSDIYNGLSNSLYVDTLIQTAAVTLPAGVRDTWITELNNSTKSRAQIFRELSERPEVSAKYLHEAQVVSCYYGFFTRNPDAAYLNFLDRLDRGEINLGDLANAFINAAEYRQRFGP